MRKDYTRAGLVVLACLLARGASPAASVEPSGDARRYALIADNQLRLGTSSRVLFGSVAVVRQLGALGVGRDGFLPGGSQAVADSARILDNAHVGALFANTASVSANAQLVGGGPFPVTLPLPLLDGLPPFPSFAGGTTPVVVPAGATLVLPPGRYGKVVVGQGATLFLRGLGAGSGAGTYLVGSLRVGFQGQVVADNPVVLDVFDKLVISGLGSLAPAPTTHLIAGDVQVNVLGTSVGFARASNVLAHLRAPRASVRLARGASFTGRLIAHRISTLSSTFTLAGACGDGLLDVNEQCDTSAPAGDGACPGECIPGDPGGQGRIALGSPGQCTCRCTQDADCSDGNACNGTETCQGGLCVAGLPPDCDDGNPCTHDCDPAVGCLHTPVADGQACSDGNPCTTPDTCQAGTCTSGPPLPDGSACSDGDRCTLADTCRAGACVGGPPRNCSDDNTCTSDGCDPLTGCTHTTLPDGSVCDDRDACTVNDACSGGTCIVGDPRNCDDGNPCTSDTCDSATGCQHAPLPDGTACGTRQTCSAGICQ